MPALIFPVQDSFPGCIWSQDTSIGCRQAKLAWNQHSGFDWLGLTASFETVDLRHLVAEEWDRSTRKLLLSIEGSLSDPFGQRHTVSGCFDGLSDQPIVSILSLPFNCSAASDAAARGWSPQAFFSTAYLRAKGPFGWECSLSQGTWSNLQSRMGKAS